MIKNEKKNDELLLIQNTESILIVVDMINAFITEGVLHDEAIAKIIPRVVEIIEENLKEGKMVILVKDSHSKNATEFKRFGNMPHSLKDSFESEFVKEIKKYENHPNVIVIEKNSTSYMESPKFRQLIRNAKNVNRVEVVGCCTDICDFNGTMGLANYMDEWNRVCEIFLHLDAIATYAEEQRQKYVDAALLLMEQQGIQFIKKESRGN